MRPSTWQGCGTCLWCLSVSTWCLDPEPNLYTVRIQNDKTVGHMYACQWWPPPWSPFRMRLRCFTSVQKDIVKLRLAQVCICNAGTPHGMIVLCVCMNMRLQVRITTTAWEQLRSVRPSPPASTPAATTSQASGKKLINHTCCLYLHVSTNISYQPQSNQQKYRTFMIQ